MAKRDLTVSPDVSEAEGLELEPADIVVRDPSVVLSVRIDSGTARQLHTIAKQRGARISDVLRDAAAEYARTKAGDPEMRFELMGPGLRVVVGRRTVDTDIARATGSGSEEEPQASVPWRSPARTAAAI
jgi:hypothetical protein